MPTCGTTTTILFDAVGTLIYPHPTVAEAYHSAGIQCGSKLAPDEIALRFRTAFARAAAKDADPIPVETDESLERHRWRTIVTEVFCELPDAGGKLFETLWRHFAQSCHWRLFDDVADVWNELQAAGFRLGVASNFDERLIGICRDLPPLSECEPRLFVSSRLGFSKPHPEFFRRIEYELQVRGDQILLVGDDRANDYAGAQAAGWRALLIDRKQQTRGPDIIHSLTEVLTRT